MVKTPSIAIISPDAATGRSFSSRVRAHFTEMPEVVIRQRTVQIPPRIIGEDLTTDPAAVSHALAEAIVHSVTAGYSWLTIACNTLSLPVFVTPAVTQAREILKSRNADDKQVFKLVTTLRLLQRYAETRLVLATKPTTTELALTTNALTFDTIPHQDFNLQERKAAKQLVQKIIWYTKKIQGSDSSTAPKNLQKLSVSETEEKLEKSLIKLIQILEFLSINRVILACTELPDSFAFLRDRRPDISLPLLFDPADMVGKELLRLTQNAINESSLSM